MITANDLHWKHDAGLCVTARIEEFTIIDAILGDPQTTRRYSIYVDDHGTPEYCESHATLDGVLEALNYALGYDQ